MKTLFALAFALSLAIAHAQAAELSINGVEVGAPATAAAFASLGIDKDCKPAPAAVCRGNMQMGGHEVRSQVNIGPDGTIRKIFVNFQSAFFDDLDSVCVLSWGKPSAAGSQAMQNAYGAQVTAIEHDWKQPRSSASILNNLDLTHGQIVVQAL